MDENGCPFGSFNTHMALQGVYRKVVTSFADESVAATFIERSNRKRKDGRNISAPGGSVLYANLSRERPPETGTAAPAQRAGGCASCYSKPKNKSRSTGLQNANRKNVQAASHRQNNISKQNNKQTRQGEVIFILLAMLTSSKLRLS
jgi:hypothetical protein